MANDRWRCKKCGIEAACECNVGYVPAGEFAALAVERHPTWSVRRIADEYRLGRMSVWRAREATVPNGTVVKKHVGLDGKERRMPKHYAPVAPVLSKSVEKKVLSEPWPGTLIVPDNVDSVSTPPVSNPTEPVQGRAMARREPTLEQRVAKLEKLYQTIVKARRGGLPPKFVRLMTAFLAQPQNVSESTLQYLREEWDIYKWIMTSEKTLPTPTLTEAGINVKEKS